MLCSYDLGLGQCRQHPFRHKGQVTQPFTSQRKDPIANRRADWANRRFTDAAWLAVASFQQHNLDMRSITHGQQGISVKVIEGNRAIFDRHLFDKG